MNVILQMEPLWGTSESVTALYGIPRRRLLDLARTGHIRARKLSPDSRSSTIVFRTADVKDWLENEAPKPRTESFEPTRGARAAAGATPVERVIHVCVSFLHARRWGVTKRLLVSESRILTGDTRRRGRRTQTGLTCNL